MFLKNAKPVSISLSPNAERDDVALALKLIFQPWKWKKGKAIEKIEEEFKKYQGAKYAVSFNSGRSSFYAILKSLNLPAGSEILLQAFTCNAVPNPILWAGLTPIFVDCDENNFNIDIEDLKSKITKNSKAVVVQHTFGLPALMEEILKICQENNLILIEDCAHSLGAEYDNKRVGTFGKVAFFSFSRDKVISSVYGGMAVTNDEKIGEALRQAQCKMGFPNLFWIFQQLLHPVLLNYIVLPVYNFLDLGKIVLIFSQWTHVLSKAVHWKEKRGKMPDYFPRAFPNALAILAINQFEKLDRFYRHRRKISEIYYNALKNGKFEVFEELNPQYLDSIKGKHSYLRFTVKHKKAHEIIYESWHKENILVGDWYTSPVAPFDTKLDKVGYKKGTCPKAERLSDITFNLPTHIGITPETASRILTKMSGML